MPMKRTQLYIDNKLYKELNMEAARERRTVSSLVRELLAKEINMRKMKKTAKGSHILLQLASFAAEGPEDLSTRGEDYLIEDFRL